MLYLYTGTDREKARAAMQKEIARGEKEGRAIVRITDAHTAADLSAALQGGGMFDGPRVVVCENVLANEEMNSIFLDALPIVKEASDRFLMFEEKVLAATRKTLEKYAEKSEKFDAAKKTEDTGVFLLARALERRDKKALWVGYMREIGKSSAPEMVHGVLFWAAKSQLLKAGNNEKIRAHSELLVTRLAELPHEARRKGFDLEYALERFVLAEA